MKLSAIKSNEFDNLFSNFNNKKGLCHCTEHYEAYLTLTNQ